MIQKDNGQTDYWTDIWINNDGHTDHLIDRCTHELPQGKWLGAAEGQAPPVQLDKHTTCVPK